MCTVYGVDHQGKISYDMGGGQLFLKQLLSLELPGIKNNVAPYNEKKSVVLRERIQQGDISHRLKIL